MNANLRYAAALAALICFSAPSTALAAVSDAPGSTAQLYSQCKDLVSALDGGVIDSRDINRAMGTGVCSGYLHAFKDAQMFIPHGSATHACIPTSATVLQLSRVFVRWAEQHPQDHHVDRAFAVFASMRESFPCAE